jgi:cyanophycin synthetase
MELGGIGALRGPNIWGRCSVLEVELPRCDGTPAFASRLLRWVPSLAGQHNGSISRSDQVTQAGEVSPFQGPFGLAHALCRLMLRLQSQAGSEVHLGLVDCRGRLARVVVEYEEEELARACLESARRICLAALGNHPVDVAAEKKRLRELALEVRLGPSTAAIVRAARQRGIPVRRLNTRSLVQLGHAARARRICTAETDRTSAVAETIAQDKQLTRSLLQKVGVPVPEGRPVSDAEDAWAAAQEVGLPVVVKPQCGNHGRGVTVHLSTREAVLLAYEAALAEGQGVMVERYVAGADHRLLVVGDRLVAAARREPAHVVGDGSRAIAELVALVNQDPRRSDGHGTVLSIIRLDAIALAVLAEQGYTAESIPPAGQRVLIRRNANLSTGGTATDVTDLVHPSVAARAVDAARTVGLDIAGIDVLATDISQSLEEQRGAVVEVNAGPGLRMHLEPSAGKPRPVGEAIVAQLFPEGQTGRIPIVAVTGVNGTTTTARLLAHLLARPGEVVGMACSDGLFIGGRRIAARDATGPDGARGLLLNPRVSVAVLEIAPEGTLREGLGFDHADVVVVTHTGQGSHRGRRGIKTGEDLARAERVLVEAVAPTGTVALNAADAPAAGVGSSCPRSVLFFSHNPTLPALVAQQRRGGCWASVRDGTVVVGEGEQEVGLAPLACIRQTHGGRAAACQVDHVLAAVAAAWSLGRRPEEVRQALESFTSERLQVPGRFEVLHSTRKR